MPNDKRLQPTDSKHTGCRNALRVIGPVILVIALLLVGSGAYEIVAGDPFENEGLMFVRMFVGMPLLFVGLVTTIMGFGGAMARYQANEMAPVGRDTVNYMVDGTKGSMRDAASAVASGLREGLAGEADEDTQGAACTQCGHRNDADARFCDECGKPIQSHTTCSDCGTQNDVDAKFCDNCGSTLRPA